jgi:AraC-like DNA-binding protein
MIYRTRAPRPEISRFVETLWFYEGLDVGHSKEKLLPDASMELIIDLSEGPKKLYDNRNLDRYTEFNQCWVSGFQRQYIVLGVQRGASMMGAHFRTGGAAPFFNFPISELAGSVVELDLIWKREILALREQLLEVPTPDQKFDLLESFLVAKAKPRIEPDDTISAALGMLNNWPVLPLKELASRLGLSHKQMLSRFDCRVGVTPKVASRIFRFQKALGATAKTEIIPDWSDLAVDCGYYDQSHMIHEFQELAGLTPTEYLRGRSQFPLYVVLD